MTRIEQSGSELADRLHQGPQIARLVVRRQRDQKFPSILCRGGGWVRHGQFIPDSSKHSASGANRLALPAGAMLKISPRGRLRQARSDDRDAGLLAGVHRCVGESQVKGREEKAGAAYGRLLSRSDKKSFGPGRPWLPYPPGRGTAGSTRICVGDTCSSERSSTTHARRTSPSSGRHRNLSAYHGDFHQSIPMVFHLCVLAERLARFSDHRPRRSARRPSKTASVRATAIKAVLIAEAG